MVLATGDDEGGVGVSGVRNTRSRQNVVFELGFFFARLGKERVAVLLESGVEKPSDVAGLAYIEIDSGGPGNTYWPTESRPQGIPVAFSKIP